MAFLVSSQATESDPGSPATHPLDPLSAAEIEAAAEAVKVAAGLGPRARFVYISLYEPAKADVIAFEARRPGPRPPGQGRDQGTGRTSHLRGDRRGRPRGSCGRWRRVPGVQPSVMFEEFLAAEDVVRADPRWQEAMRKRGVTDFDLCMIDPWSSPNVAPGLGPEDGRFVRPLTWVRVGAGRQRLRPAGRGRGDAGRPGHDDGRRASRTTASYRCPPRRRTTPPRRSPTPDNVPAFPAGPRQDVKPLDITQPDGPSFTLDGYHLRWQKWDLRIGFTAREGLVLHRIGYDGAARIIHRASLSEMFVPTATRRRRTTASWSSTRGSTASACSPTASSSAATAWARSGTWTAWSTTTTARPMVMPNAICLHEEDHGIAWKHTDFRTGYVEVRRMRRMVISCIVTVGQLRVRLLLVPVPGRQHRVRGQAHRRHLQRRRPARAEARARDARRARRVRAAPPALLQRPPGHGRRRPANRVYEVTPTALPEGPGNPVGQRVAGRGGPDRGRDAGDAQRRPARAAGTGRSSTRTSPNELGQPVGYKLRARARDRRRSPTPAPRSPGGRGFITSPLWVTAYDRDEMFATGDYPNQSEGGGGLPAFVQADATSRRHRRGALVHLRHQPRGPPGGLAGDAGPPDRLPAAPGRLLRRQPGPGQPAARRRPLPRTTETSHQRQKQNE